jgi:hypothetical protein
MPSIKYCLKEIMLALDFVRGYHLVDRPNVVFGKRRAIYAERALANILFVC